MSETEQAVTLQRCGFCRAVPSKTSGGEWWFVRHDRDCFITLIAQRDQFIPPEQETAWNTRTSAPPRDALETQEFYDLMQSYRHTSAIDQAKVCERFEAIKAFLHASFAAPVTAPVSTGRRLKPMCDDPECSVCNHMAKLHAASMEDEFNKEPATTLTTPLNRVRAKAIVGTVFDDTAASHETLKRTMIQRIENYFNIRSAATSTTPDGEREGTEQGRFKSLFEQAKIHLDHEQREREFLCHWLARAYEAESRDTSYEEGESLREVMRQINQVLGWFGYEPGSAARADLVAQSFSHADALEFTSTPPPAVTPTCGYCASPEHFSAAVELPHHEGRWHRSTGGGYYRCTAQPPAVTEAGEQEYELERVLSLLISYGAVHTVNGVTYPEGSHAAALKAAERIRDWLRAGNKIAAPPSTSAAIRADGDLLRAAKEVLEWLNFDTSLEAVQSDVYGVWAILSRWSGKGEPVRTEVERRIKSLRGVVIESGNKRDAAFVEGGIAALENLLDDLPATPAAPSPAEPPAGLRNATTLCRSGEGKPKVELWFKELADAQAVHKWLTTTIAAALRTSVEGGSE